MKVNFNKKNNNITKGLFWWKYNNKKGYLLKIYIIINILKDG